MADTRYWSKEFLTEFLEIYRKHPALWMVKSKEYKNKNLKDKGHRELIELCRQIPQKHLGPSPDKTFVCKKIQSLRSCFRKELKKMKTPKEVALLRKIFTHHLCGTLICWYSRETAKQTLVAYQT